MTVPPDFGGHEFEEGLLEDLGGPHEQHPVPHDDQAGSDWDDNELHAVGQVCARCGAVIAQGQDVRLHAAAASWPNCHADLPRLVPSDPRRPSFCSRLDVHGAA